ncbi:hypothetical protein GUJ93_ZPchr0006g41125 [Zizania palustris]|uniref:Uncharacterized protein n=1 Tax=Zizania palustris TaxID=103762 RepID=A0A8J5SKB3_ZIZPA|nr:hypothetical protein GUJ93_ZPchr0006g41125 [Zizania palustris]
MPASLPPLSLRLLPLPADSVHPEPPSDPLPEVRAGAALLRASRFAAVISFWLSRTISAPPLKGDLEGA